MTAFGSQENQKLALLLVDHADSQVLHSNWSNERNFSCICGLPVIDYLLTDLKQRGVTIVEAVVVCPRETILNFRNYEAVRPMLSGDGDVALISCSTLKRNRLSEGRRDLDFKLKSIQGGYLLVLASNILIDDATVLRDAIAQASNTANTKSFVLYTRFRNGEHKHCGSLKVNDRDGAIDHFTASYDGSGSASEENGGFVSRPVAVIYHHSHVGSISQFFQENGHEASTKVTFLPELLQFVMNAAPSASFECLQVPNAFVVNSGSLESIEAAEAHLLGTRAALLQALPDNAEERCAARIGLMGNPSDGFNGKTLSFLIDNFYAVVRIERRPRGTGVEITEPVFFSSLNALCSYSTKIGYTTGLRLLQATCTVFTRYCNSRGLSVHLLRGMRMTYTTNIPRMVGLAGSSAIITAAFKCLLQFNNLTIGDLGLQQKQLPQILLDIERLELGISAGLQDRVVQVYGGLMYMDFSQSSSHTGNDDHDSSANDSNNIYASLDPNMLPEMYLAYDAFAGGDSGHVHSSVKSRWAEQDEDLVQGMQLLGQFTDQAVDLMQKLQTLTAAGGGGSDVEIRACKSELASLMNANFATRRRLYGDAVVGAKNIAVAELLQQKGFGAKFTGSGGAFVCMRSDGGGWLDSVPDEEDMADELHKLGFAFQRIRHC